MIEDHEIVAEYFAKIIKPELLIEVKQHNFSKNIAVHIRLGDYTEDLRIPISWYKSAILKINEITNNGYQFLVFSDGSEEELVEILKIENVQFYFAGNAIADIVSISRCIFLLGSDSTFSGWGAFLGQVPSIFAKKHYGRILQRTDNELVVSEIADSEDVELLIRRILLS